MKLSIVTPSFNQCHFLRQTIECVLSQSGNFELEMLVVDGASTDGTVDLLRSIVDPRFSWRSERDEGQTDALRKGLSQLSGDVIGWLNSDDLYTPGALGTVARAFANSPQAQWLVGRSQIIDAKGREIQRWITRYKDRQLRKYSFRSLLRQNYISQMSVFWRREFGRAVGDPDVTLHHAMDYDLWLRMAKHCDPQLVDEVLSQFRIHQASKTSTVFRKRFQEHYEVARRHAGQDWWSLLLNRLNAEKIVLSYSALWAMGLMSK